MTRLYKCEQISTRLVHLFCISNSEVKHANLLDIYFLLTVGSWRFGGFDLCYQASSQRLKLSNALQLILIEYKKDIICYQKSIRQRNAVSRSSTR